MEDFSRRKLTITLALALLALSFLAFLLFRFLVTTEEAVGPEPEGRVTGRLPSVSRPGEELSRAGELKPGESLTISPEQRLIRITDFPVASPALNKEENRIFFYKKIGGDLLSADFNGLAQEKISNITVVGLLEAIWSPERDRAAVFYLEQESLKGFIHQETEAAIALPQDVRSLSWSPDGSALAYLVPKGNRLALITADSKGRTKGAALTETPLLDSSIHWVTSDKIAFATAPSGLADGFLFLFSRSSGAFKKIAGPLNGLTALWSPDGTRVLIASTNKSGKELHLSVHDSSGKEVLVTDLKTLPEKCAWSGSDELYCATPRSIAPTLVLPDDYLRGEVNTQDNLAVIDLARKEARTIFSEEGFDMINILLTKKKEYLFFVNRTDGSLWSLKLK